MQIRCTQKLIKEIGISGCDLSPIEEPKNRLGSWYANMFKVGRYKTLICVNEKTLLCFFIMRVTKKDLQDFSALFVRNLTDALEVLNFNTSEIISIENECSNFTGITKTVDRKVLGAMNELVFHFCALLQDGCSLEETLFHCNQIPHKNLKTNAIEALLDLTVRSQAQCYT